MNKKSILLFLLISILIFPFVSNAQSTTLNNLVASIGRTAESVGAIMATLGFLISGILWFTSGGSPEKTGLAKKALIAAVIGTVILVIGSASNTFIKIIREALGNP